MRNTLSKMLSLSVPVMLAASLGYADPPSYPSDLDLTASKWTEYNGHTPGNDAEGSLYLDFPSLADDSCKQTHTCETINMLYTTYVNKVLTGKTLLISLKVEALTGSPVFQYTETTPPESCSFPPTVRAFFWAYNLDEGNGDRWWSDNVSYVLSPGAVTWFIPLDPHTFRGVDGQLGDSDSWHSHWWTSAIKNVSAIGVTFGGCSSFAHGIFVTGGTARFTLQNYEVIPPPPNCPSVSPCPGLTGDCIRGAEGGATNQNMNRCLQADGSLFDCGSQSVYVVTNRCQRAACCVTNPPTCLCLPSCPTGGTYLECR